MTKCLVSFAVICVSIFLKCKIQEDPFLKHHDFLEVVNFVGFLKSLFWFI